MVEIRAAETKRATAAGKNNRGAPAEIFATVVAARLPVRMKTRRSREAPSSAAPSQALSRRAVVSERLSCWAASAAPSRSSPRQGDSLCYGVTQFRGVSQER
jgi:hypothetical protein